MEAEPVFNPFALGDFTNLATMTVIFFVNMSPRGEMMPALAYELLVAGDCWYGLFPDFIINDERSW